MPNMDGVKKRELLQDIMAILGIHLKFLGGYCRLVQTIMGI